MASEVNDSFWREFRAAVKGEKPDALLIGEVWESAGHWLGGDMFDSTMNYDFRKHCELFFARGTIDAEGFAGRLTGMLMRYRRQMVPAQLNLLDSHDVERFLSLCGGNTEKYRMAVLFEMTFIGMPTIFYGGELGLDGVLEDEYRRPMPWENGNQDLRDFFRRAIHLRRELPALRRGNFRVISAKADSGLLVFSRQFENQTVTVAMNTSPRAERLSLAGENMYWAEGLAGDTLSPWGFAVAVD